MTGPVVSCETGGSGWQYSDQYCEGHLHPPPGTRDDGVVVLYHHSVHTIITSPDGV